MNKEELLPCPFCGQEADLSCRLCDEFVDKYDWQVKCHWCFATVGGFETKEIAILRWNFRYDKQENKS